LGALDNSFLRANQWRLGIQYRFLPADKFYVGHDYTPTAVMTPHHLAIVYRIHTMAARVEYGITDRFDVAIGIPLSTGRESREEDDQQRHAQAATGFGDVVLVGSAWLLNPIAHGNGNIRVGLGLKAPTGNNSVSDKYYTATDVRLRPVDPAIELGDGGWGAIAQFEAFRAIRWRVSVYAAGSYLSNPRVHTNVPIFAPMTGVTRPVSVADEYSAHAGVSYYAWSAGGLSFSLGGRIDGVPVRDLFGWNDTSFRRPGYVVYAEPTIALTMMRGPFAIRGHTFSLSVPVAVDQNRETSLLDKSLGRHGGGDFARYLVFLGYTRRF
jgi:hypothetical protein